jgi:peptidoglycan/LPS O-acetylase OafA/YrhL
MSRSPATRIPSLDGLRALSIGMVIAGHLVGTGGFSNGSARLHSILATMASLGVRIFFVISGFLITTLLHRELAERGEISLGQFYFRRTMRIFPACYVYLAALLLAQHLGWLALRRWDLLSAATYTTNYHRDRSWYAGQTWSLGVEEQFYLLWPLAMKVLSKTRARHLALAVIFLAPLVRIATFQLAPSLRPGIGETFPTVADALAAGCLLALSREEGDRNQRYLNFLSHPAFVLMPLVVIAVALLPSARLHFLVGETVLNVCVALIIDRVVRFPATMSARVLNTRPLVWLGTISYSLYLWQQPFMAPGSASPVQRFPLNIGLALLAAILSYRLVEKPMLALRGRIERSHPVFRPAPSRATN